MQRIKIVIKTLQCVALLTEREYQKTIGTGKLDKVKRHLTKLKATVA